MDVQNDSHHFVHKRETQSLVMIFSNPHLYTHLLLRFLTLTDLFLLGSWIEKGKETQSQLVLSVPAFLKHETGLLVAKEGR